MRTHDLALLVLTAAGLLGSSPALAQDSTATPGPRINRNPEFRNQLPPAPGAPQDVRDAVVPPAGAADPRDSTTRPVTAPSANNDGRSVLVPGTAAQAPLPAPASSAPVGNRP